MLKFIIILLLWFISTIFFPYNISFYQSLNLPFFTPPTIVFGIVWPILYILISISIYKIYRDNHIQNIFSYNISLIINYLFNQLYSFVFFTLENVFLGFIFSLGTFISSLFLYYETKQLNKDATKYLIPYILWNLFATILSLTIYFMNF